MKKKLLLMVTAVIIAVSGSATITAVMSTWVMVNDPCKKCRVSDDVKYCGKCKDDTMYDSKHRSYKEGKHYVTEYVYKCKECEHTSTWKAYD